MHGFSHLLRGDADMTFKGRFLDWILRETLAIPAYIIIKKKEK